MKLRSFADELDRLHAGRSALTKIAKGNNMFAVMGGVGAASGLAGLGLGHLKHMVTGDPYDEPIGTSSGAAITGGLGGLTTAGILSLIERAGKKAL